MINNNRFGCLLPNEEVITYAGLKKMIDVEIDDKIMTVDGSYHLVTKIWQFTKPVYYISFNNGEHIECSNTHRFLVNKSKMDKEPSWKTAEELHDGDEVYFISIINNTAAIQFKRVKISRMFKSGECPVYDLTIKDSLTYITANGIINHSF